MSPLRVSASSLPLDSIKHFYQIKANYVCVNKRLCSIIISPCEKVAIGINYDIISIIIRSFILCFERRCR